jgi:hypothetical protein
LVLKAKWDKEGLRVTKVFKVSTIGHVKLSQYKYILSIAVGWSQDVINEVDYLIAVPSARKVTQYNIKKA